MTERGYRGRSTRKPEVPARERRAWSLRAAPAPSTAAACWTVDADYCSRWRAISSSNQQLEDQCKCRHHKSKSTQQIKSGMEFWKCFCTKWPFLFLLCYWHFAGLNVLWQFRASVSSTTSSVTGTPPRLLSRSLLMSVVGGGGYTAATCSASSRSDLGSPGALP